MTILYLLPGLMCDETVWQHQQQALSDQADVRIPNFRGFNSISAMAESVLEQVSGKIALAGHSMGGRVAFEIVHKAPEKVSRLALMDTSISLINDEEMKTRQKYLDLADKGGIQAVIDSWLKPMVYHEFHDDQLLMGEIKKMLSRTTVKEFKDQIHALINRPDASNYLKSILCPTLVLCGREDSWAKFHGHEQMAREIHNAKLVVVENAGHMAPMEQPEAVSRALKDWLKQS